MIFLAQCIQNRMSKTALIGTGLPSQSPAIAPFIDTETDLSGIIRSSSNSILYPSPKQSGQAPNGLLKEKLLGSISSILIPQSGQEKLWLKFSRFPIRSHPQSSALPPGSVHFLWNLSDVFQSLALTTRRSTTISILCLIFLSSCDLFGKFIHISVNPAHGHNRFSWLCSSSFTCVPFLPAYNRCQQLDLGPFRQVP